MLFVGAVLSNYCCLCPKSGRHKEISLCVHVYDDD